MSEVIDRMVEPYIPPQAQAAEEELLPLVLDEPMIPTPDPTKSLEVIPPASSYSSDPITMYLNEIGKVPLLNKEQVQDFSKRIEAGLYAAAKLSDETLTIGDEERQELEVLRKDGELSKENMIKANLKLVVFVAKYFAGRGVAFLDLIQDGNEGLIRAVEMFDYKKDYEFSTYAVWWIRQSINKGVANNARTVRLPIGVTEILKQMRKYENKILVTTGREATEEELMAEFKLKPERLKLIREMGRSVLSLDEPIGEDGDDTLSSLIVDEAQKTPQDVAIMQVSKQELDACVNLLNERERVIIIHRYGLNGTTPKTLSQTGEIIGLTRERVRQIEKLAVVHLRNLMLENPA